MQSQEKEAKDEMKRKAKELQMAKREARREGRSMYSGGYGGGGFGSHDMRGGGPTVESLPPQEPKKSFNAPRSDIITTMYPAHNAPRSVSLN